MSVSYQRKTLRAMVRLYCTQQHQSAPLCEPCSELLEYAEQRLDKCPYGEEKHACQECDIHCYCPEMQSRIVEVMQYAGPRMILHRPIMALRHLFHTMRSKKKQKQTCDRAP